MSFKSNTLLILLLAVTTKSETWPVVLREECLTFYNKRRSCTYFIYQFDRLCITAGVALGTEGSIIISFIVAPCILIYVEFTHQQMHFY